MRAVEQSRGVGRGLVRAEKGRGGVGSKTGRGLRMATLPSDTSRPLSTLAQASSVTVGPRSWELLVFRGQPPAYEGLRAGLRGGGQDEV